MKNWLKISVTDKSKFLKTISKLLSIPYLCIYIIILIYLNVDFILQKNEATINLQAFVRKSEYYKNVLRLAFVTGAWKWWAKERTGARGRHARGEGVFSQCAHYLRLLRRLYFG